MPLPRNTIELGLPAVVMHPWDLLRGLDVFADRSKLEDDLSSATVVHWAPNCATFSRAREIPVPGAKCAPVPLRNEAHPEGIPGMKLSLRSRSRLELDTDMANLSADKCVEFHVQGKLFSLEHTGRSLALHLPSWKRLMAMPGVIVLV